MTVWKQVLRATLPVLLAVTVASAPAAPTPPREPDALDALDALDAYVAEQQDRTGVPGVAYAVVGPDGVRHEGATGVDGDGEPVSAATPFLWGSVSKPVAATLVVALAEEGLLDLDDRVTEHLPSFGTSDPVSRRATVRDLLTHTAGLPEGLALTDRYEPDRTPAEVVAETADLDPVAAPGERHAYSSLGYVVLAAVVEEVTGQTYGDALDQRVLSPAGMTGVPGDPAEAEQVLPPGHRYVLGTPRAFDTGVDPTGQAAGYLVGGLADLAAFARTQLSSSTLLDAAQRSALHEPTVATGEDAGYGLGWRTSALPGTDEPLVWHGGAAPGYTSAIVLLPERDAAVVVLQDAYGPFQEGALLDTAFGLAAGVAGEEPPGPTPVDAVYPGLLAGLAALALVLLVAAAVPARRVVGQVVRGAVVVVAVAGLLALPAVFGVPLGHLALWAPDVAALVVADLVLCGVVAVLAGLAVLRTRRRRRARGTPAAAR